MGNMDTKKVTPAKNGHENRGLKTIRDIIDRGDLTDSVKVKSMAIFESLARVEGHIHNLPPDQVHFHEVGAVDSIIDIVGTVYALETLGIERLLVSPLPLGSGFVKTAHGRMPVPAPATLALLKGIPVLNSGVQQEMVTPHRGGACHRTGRVFWSHAPHGGSKYRLWGRFPGIAGSSEPASHHHRS